MFPGISEKGYERCIGTWAEILYEVIVAAAEGERDKRMGITSWELYCPGARRGELEDVENKICMLVQTKSGYLVEGRVGVSHDGEVELLCSKFRSEEAVRCDVCGDQFY